MEGPLEGRKERKGIGPADSLILAQEDELREHAFGVSRVNHGNKSRALVPTAVSCCWCLERLNFPILNTSCDRVSFIALGINTQSLLRTLLESLLNVNGCFGI